MARLRSGEKQAITNTLFRLLHKHDFGLTEHEIADLTQMERRRLNNYLRELEASDKIYKEGRQWFVG